MTSILQTVGGDRRQVRPDLSGFGPERERDGDLPELDGSGLRRPDRLLLASAGFDS